MRLYGRVEGRVTWQEMHHDLLWNWHAHEFLFSEVGLECLPAFVNINISDYKIAEAACDRWTQLAEAGVYSLPAVADLDYSPLLELTSVYVFIWRRETNDQWRSHVVHWMRHGVQTEQEHFRCVVRLLLLRLENCELHADIVEAIVAQLRVVNTC
jgi:hypothetical protein